MKSSAEPQDSEEYIKKRTKELLEDMEFILSDNTLLFRDLLIYVLNTGKTFQGKHIDSNVIEEFLIKNYPDLLKYEVGNRLHDEVFDLIHDLYLPYKDLVTLFIIEYMNSPNFGDHNMLLGSQENLDIE